MNVKMTNLLPFVLAEISVRYSWGYVDLKNANFRVSRQKGCTRGRLENDLYLQNWWYLEIWNGQNDKLATNKLDSKSILDTFMKGVNEKFKILS